MRETILSGQSLTKQFKNGIALDSADFAVYKGDIYGIVGRNGAGKTTLMKLVTGLTEKTGGEYTLFGKPSVDARNEHRRIGCLIERPCFFQNMSAYSNLRYYCIQKGIVDDKQIRATLEMVGLDPSDKKKFRQFSLGMKQRLGIAFTLLESPDLVILDEPINGLDPIGIADMRETFFKLNREQNVTFVISSHILSELYAVANRFLFIDKGKVIKQISKEEIDAECSRCTVLNTDDLKKTAAVLEREHGIGNYKVTGKDEIRIYDRTVKASGLIRSLVMNGIEVNAVYESGADLEDYFKRLVGDEKEAAK